VPSQKREALINAILAARKMSLCMRVDCPTGCVGAFRRIVKEALVGRTVSYDEVHSLTPAQRTEILTFMFEERDFLTNDENKLLYSYCRELNPQIPEENEQLAMQKAERESAALRRAEQWRLQVAERRAAKRKERQERHTQRLTKKRERDHIYWIAYWAARHSMHDMQQEVSLLQSSGKKSMSFFSGALWRKLMRFVCVFEKSR
jgi:hypothetical protein